MSHGLRLILLTAVCVVCAHAQDAARSPYPPSTLITAQWDFSTVVPMRQARGSDMWPCAWAQDDELYCSWGDGGGFGGSDGLGRASLGFARVEGMPATDDSDSVRGINVWGSAPTAEHNADFGGKVGSMIAVDGVLYATGGFFTTAHVPDPVRADGMGPYLSLIWSDDLGKTWHIAPWSTPEVLGTFLNFGKNNEHARDEYVYLYYLRAEDPQHVFLKRVLKSHLKTDPARAHAYEYFSGTRRGGMAAKWSQRPRAAKPVFADDNRVDFPDVVYVPALNRYLLTIGHNPSGEERDASIGQLGLFEGPEPWGPWSTVDYQDDWGGFGDEGKGDYLGLRFPTKWISADGRTLWGVFSGLRSLDSFNVVKLTLATRATDDTQRAPTQ